MFITDDRPDAPVSPAGGHGPADSAVALEGILRIARMLDEPTALTERAKSLAEAIMLDPEEYGRRALLDLGSADKMLARDLLDWVFPSVAQHLEIGWNEDRLSFVDVTIASTRMQQTVRALGPPARSTPVNNGVTMIVPPWEQHGLAASIAAQKIRAMGVPVRMITGKDRSEAARALDVQRPAALFVSVGSTRAALGLPEFLQHIRKSSKRALPIAVGGPALVGFPDLAKRTGADIATNDVAKALGFCDIELCKGNETPDSLASQHN